MSEIGTFEFVFLLLLLFVIVFGLLARKIGTPYPIVMVVGGLLLSFIPGLPKFGLHPDLIFLIVLPPLLYSSAWATSWRDFRYNLISILFLAIGLVVFTVVGVALVAPNVLTGFDWQVGLALGAVVAPTDAIAATSIARRVGLPSRIVDVLEGESLINDATGLLALELATAMVVDRTVPTAMSGLLTFLWLTIGGIAIGLLVGKIVELIELRIDNGPIEITLSIFVPYAVYLVSNEVHASGVLAVVACGLFLSRRSAHFFSPVVRIQVWSVWESLAFVLNGVVFVLIGLQLPLIRAGIRGYNLRTLLIDGAAFSVILIILRLTWVLPGSTFAYYLRNRFDNQHEKRPTLKQRFVIGWTGMRGVVSLAAALALPATRADGTAFPHRDLVVFLTFCVIFVTLVLQGITLPPLIRALGLAGAEGPNCEELEARRLVMEAAVSHLEESKERDVESAEVYDDLTQHYRHRLATLQSDGASQELTHHDRFTELSLETTRVEREMAIRLRNEGRINDVILRRIERELDLTETRLAVTGDD